MAAPSTSELTETPFGTKRRESTRKKNSLCFITHIRRLCPKRSLIRFSSCVKSVQDAPGPGGQAFSVEKCSSHFIRVTVLEELVSEHIKLVLQYVAYYEDYFRSVMEEQLKLENEGTIKASRKRLSKAEKRLNERDHLFIRIYEDNVSGRISDERFALMSKTHEDEQAELKKQIGSLRDEIDRQGQQMDNLDRFIQTAGKYADLQSLTPYALRELVKAIYLENVGPRGSRRRVNIKISCDFIGYIPLDKLMGEGSV